MSDIRYQLKKRLFRLKAYRRRKSGRRSAFAFDLITNVIDAKLHYYAFGELQRNRELALQLLRSSCKSSAVSTSRANFLKEEILSLKRGKDSDRLIFRLMNHDKVKRPLFIGNGLAYSKAYMAKVDSRIQVNCIGDCLKNEGINAKIFKEELKIDNIQNVLYEDLEAADFVVISNLISKEDIEFFVENYHKFLHPKCSVILLNMRKNPELTMCWKRLKEDEKFHFCMDMYSLGLLISDDRIGGKEYISKNLNVESF